MKLIAIDIGTTRIKAALFDDQGRMARIVDRRLDVAASPEIRDARCWSRISDELLRKITSGTDIDGVVLTGNMHALLGVDASGEPVAPARLWSDSSATAEADSLRSRLGDKILAVTGDLPLPLFPIAKMVRMKREAPDLYHKSVAFLQPKDFVGYALTGEMATDPSDASGTLLMDLSTGEWAADLVREAGLDLPKLPEIRPSAALRGHVTPEAARRTGLRAGTPVFTGSGDLASAAIGSGCDGETFSLTLGTSGQLLAVGTPGHFHKLSGRLFVFAHADPAKELYLGSVPAGGYHFEWISSLHDLPIDDFFQIAATCPIREDLPIFLPYVMGRGAPYMEYKSEGAWLRLDAKNTRAELFRSAVLGTLSALRESADLFEEIVGPRPRIVLQSLASREDVVRETACRLFHQRKLLPRNDEASLQGAAIIALVGLGVYADYDSAIHAVVRNEPSDGIPPSKAAETWFRRFQAASQTLRDKLF